MQKLADHQYGINAHAPILVMFVLDARRVLSLNDVFFSDANMQKGAIESSTEDFFRSIPFGKVYHEGGTGGDRSIIAHRCAEVLAPSPMELDDKLRWVYCRSEAERATLITALGKNAAKWERRIIVSDDLKVFEKRYAFVDKVLLTNEGVMFRLNPRSDAKPISVSLEVRDAAGQMCVRMNTTELPASPLKASAWQVKAKLRSGLYKVVITLEGHQAYNSSLILDDIPF